MALDRHISANQITGIILLLLGLVFAVYVGMLIGNEDFGVLSSIFIGGFGGIIYFAILSPFWIWLSFAWAVFGFPIRPFGPLINELHIALAQMAIFLFAYAWRKAPATPSQKLVQSYFRPFQIALLVYLAYMAINAIMTMYFPNEPLAVSWGNLAKQNVEMWGGFVLVAITLQWAQFCRLPNNLGNWMVAVLILAIVANTVIRAYATFVLGLGETAQSGALPNERGQTALFIQGINLADSPYTLRAMAPFGALLGVALLSSAPIATLGAVSTSLCRILIAVSLVASPFAGGRATVLLTVFLPGIFLLFRKRFAALFVLAAFGILMLAGLRYVHDVNYKLIPPMVQRSIAIIPGMQMNEARDGIDSSSNWRYDLAMRALDEWRSSIRTAILGRGVYAFTGEDITAIMLDASEGTLESSLLRGATHNAMVDHLLITGVLGLVLYHITLFSLIWGIYRIYQTRTNFDLLASLCFVFLIQTTTLFLVGFLGSGFFWVIVALLAATIVTIASNLPADLRRQAAVASPHSTRRLSHSNQPHPPLARLNSHSM